MTPTLQASILALAEECPPQDSDNCIAESVYYFKAGAQAMLDILSKQEGVGDYPSADVCCCGDSMKNHQNAFDAGHMPVSALYYYLSCKSDELLAERARSAKLVAALEHYSSKAMKVGSTISPRHADKALKEAGGSDE